MRICLPSFCVSADDNDALLRFGLFLESEQGLDFRRDFSLVHGRAPLFVHFQFLSETTDGCLPTGHQLFQILISEFLSGPALSCTLPAPLKLSLQVNLGRLPPTFTRLLHFASNHLAVIHLGRRAGLAGRALPLPAPGSQA